MIHDNKQPKGIYTLTDVEDLSYDTAANVQGGAAMTLYRHADLQGDVLAEFDGGGVRTMSSNADNQASSVSITEGRWEFYKAVNWIDFPFEGDSVTLGPGTYNFLGDFNDNISSFRRVG